MANTDYLFSKESAFTKYEAARAPQKIVYFDSFDQAKAILEEGGYDLTGAIAAKVSDDVMIRVNKGELICVKNASLTDVNTVLLKQQYQEKYQITYKVAEFHGWLEIKNIETGLSAHIGAGPVPVGAWFNGEFHVRYDTHYNDKYFNGHQVIDDSTRFDHHNKGSSEVMFEVGGDALDRAQAQVIQEIADHPEGNTKFQFTHNNCHEFAFRVLNAALGTNCIRAVEFENADVVDLADQGISYNFWYAYGPSNYFLNNFDYVRFHVAKNLPTDPISGLVHKYQNYAFNAQIIEDMQKPNFDPNTIIKDDFGGLKPGNTLLNFAIEAGYLNTAKKLLEFGADVNISDKYGLTPLHKIAASTIMSDEKYELLRDIASKSVSVNILDCYGEMTPLAEALITQDLKATQILIEEFGADYNLVNDLSDNVIHIAADYKISDHDLINYMYDLAPDLFYVASGNRQLPFYRDSINNELLDREPLCEPLSSSDAFNKIANEILVEQMFSDLKCFDI